MKNYLKLAVIVIIFILASTTESYAQDLTWKNVPAPTFGGAHIFKPVHPQQKGYTYTPQYRKTLNPKTHQNVRKPNRYGW